MGLLRKVRTALARRRERRALKFANKPLGKEALYGKAGKEFSGYLRGVGDRKRYKRALEKLPKE